MTFAEEQSFPVEGGYGARGAHDYLAVADGIGRRLLEEAVWHEDRCTWFGHDLELLDEEWKPVYRTVDHYLYAGTSGIATFLVQLWRATDENRYLETALAALRQSLAKLPRDADKFCHGYFSGDLGVLAAALTLAELVKDKEAGDTAHALAADLVGRIAYGEHLDIMDGASGTLLGLIESHRVTGDDRFMAEAARAAGHLIEQARTCGESCSWRQPGDAPKASHLCGLGHGASSVAYPLLELYDVTGHDAYREAAFSAFRYERGWFDRSENNWPDLRGCEEGPDGARGAAVYPVYWCYGAAGIALSRLRAYEITQQTNMLAEAGAALSKCMERAERYIRCDKAFIRSFDGNLSVCHGVGSLLDVLLYAYGTLGCEAYLTMARELGDAALRFGRSRGEWRCGIQKCGESPGMMTGLAGIGMNYLRLYRPRLIRPMGL